MFVMIHKVKCLRKKSRENLNYDEFILKGESESSDDESEYNKTVYV